MAKKIINKKYRSPRGNCYGFGSDIKSGIQDSINMMNGADMLSGAAAALSDVAYSGISGGLDSKGGKLLNGVGDMAGKIIPGPLGKIAEFGVKGIGGLFNRAFGSDLNQENISAVENNISSLNNFNSNASSFDALNAAMLSAPASQGFNQKFIGKDGWFANKAKKKFRNLKVAQAEAEANVENALMNNLENLDASQDQGLAANYKAFGGNLSSNGADWNAGFTYIGNGGTHEENPLDGVQFGVDNGGTPNLVEQGEFIHDGYAESNRIILDAEDLEAANLPKKYAGKTPAAIGKILSKEHEERPNNAISLNGFKDSMNRLRTAQEYHKQKEAAKGNNLYSNENIFALGDEIYNTETNQWDFETDRGAFSRLVNDQGAFTPYRNHPNYNANSFRNAVADAREKWINAGTQQLPEISVISSAPKSPELVGLDGNLINTKMEAPKIEGSEFGIPDTPTSPYVPRHWDPFGQDVFMGGRPTWLRYAPIAGAGLGIAHNLLSKPDYNTSNTVANAARGAADYDRVSFNPVGDYLTYRPLDRQYGLNYLSGAAGGMRRGLANTGSASTRQASILASDNNYINSIGNLLRQAEESNQAQRERIFAANTSTNRFNSEGDLKAQMANQAIRQQASGQYLSGITHAMSLRDAVDARRSADFSANLTGFFEGLGDIGRENYEHNNYMNYLMTQNPTPYRPQGMSKKVYERWKAQAAKGAAEAKALKEKTAAENKAYEDRFKELQKQLDELKKKKEDNG